MTNCKIYFHLRGIPPRRRTSQRHVLQILWKQVVPLVLLQVDWDMAFIFFICSLDLLVVWELWPQNLVNLEPRFI